MKALTDSELVAVSGGAGGGNKPLIRQVDFSPTQVAVASVAGFFGASIISVSRGPHGQVSRNALKVGLPLIGVSLGTIAVGVAQAAIKLYVG